jgi:hypothetical protein
MEESSRRRRSILQLDILSREGGAGAEKQVLGIIKADNEVFNPYSRSLYIWRRS